jgi:hypothetical protein
MGVMIEAGIVKEGTPICVPSREVSYLLQFIFKVSVVAPALVLKLKDRMADINLISLPLSAR